VTTRTFRRIFDYNNRVLRRKPVRSAGQDLRELPTYTIPEAAAFLGLPVRTLRSWYLGTDPIFRPSAKVGGIPLLSFFDLVDAHIVQVARRNHKVPMSRIRDGIRQMRKEGSKTRHPLQDENIRIFARQLVLVHPGGRGRRRQITNISRHGQAGIPSVIEKFMKRIVRDSAGMPTGLYPWRLPDKTNRTRPVAIYPDVMSGRLVLSGTRVPVALLQSEVLAGNSPEHLAKEYRVPVKRIKEALRHFDSKAA
jgi:uncharacterized protein (DUF433 family)